MAADHENVTVVFVIVAAGSGVIKAAGVGDPLAV